MLEVVALGRPTMSEVAEFRRGLETHRVARPGRDDGRCRADACEGAAGCRGVGVPARRVGASAPERPNRRRRGRRAFRDQPVRGGASPFRDVLRFDPAEPSTGFCWEHHLEVGPQGGPYTTTLDQVTGEPGFILDGRALAPAQRIRTRSLQPCRAASAELLVDGARRPFCHEFRRCDPHGRRRPGRQPEPPLAVVTAQPPAAVPPVRGYAQPPLFARAERRHRADRTSGQIKAGHE